MKVQQNGKFSKQRISDNDKKPFKVHHEQNKWTPKAEFESKAVDQSNSNWYNTVSIEADKIAIFDSFFISHYHEKWMV